MNFKFRRKREYEILIINLEERNRIITLSSFKLFSGVAKILFFILWKFQFEKELSKKVYFSKFKVCKKNEFGTNNKYICWLNRFFVIITKDLFYEQFQLKFHDLINFKFIFSISFWLGNYFWKNSKYFVSFSNYSKNILKLKIIIRK